MAYIYLHCDQYIMHSSKSTAENVQATKGETGEVLGHMGVS